MDLSIRPFICETGDAWDGEYNLTLPSEWPE